ncbi:methyltransferase domain-containing protein [Aeromonas salmonicida]|uniref:methyltransferase domain-containing protein n=5 Tax=Aeromonas salmonicida TaxID=645 RepID=UPI000C8891C7|nr:methyltransferase domain-containing protein [Aeromonas salmonicida]PMU05676.1 hypothetical protein CJI17_07675 [Aeromonas salmonicida]
MKCIICGSLMSYFFTKEFNEFNLTHVDYWKCSYCGFCASKTHFEMSEKEWSGLNDAFHSKTHFAEGNPYNRNQRYFNQSLMLSLMAKQKLINVGKWLDWGCGVGAIAILLKDYFDFQLLTYDKFFTQNVNSVNINDLKQRSFDLVVNTAVFEHVRNRDTLEEIESYVSDTGCLAIHTLIPATVPKDPNWMYLLPVHCAFHTNQSMGLLMRSWGYKCSVYNEHSKMWVLFRENADAVWPRVDKLNKSLGWRYLHFKDGFMDYWK